MAKILISGGSGLVGRAISQLLLQKGHEPVWLSRQGGRKEGINSYQWDIQKGTIDERAFEGTDHLIHLAGAGIADRRWTKKYKQEIIDSRVKSSELLYSTVERGGSGIRSLTGASAVGYYGSGQSEHVFEENDAPGDDYLANVCVKWENSYRNFQTSGIRTTILRTGVVLARNGGAYSRMLPPFRLGLGATPGSGRQYFPWIHIADIAAMYVESCLNENIHGAYNAVAPQIITSRQFTEALAASLGKPFFLPAIPAALLRLVMGESASALTGGVKVSPRKISEAGFEFKFKDIQEALADLAGQ
jgi:uncharacterized protein